MQNKDNNSIFWFKNGTPIGQQMGANTLRDVTRAITDHIEPKIYPTVEKVVLDGKNCIKVVLPEKIFQKCLSGQ